MNEWSSRRAIQRRPDAKRGTGKIVGSDPLLVAVYSFLAVCLTPEMRLTFQRDISHHKMFRYRWRVPSLTFLKTNSSCLAICRTKISIKSQTKKTSTTSGDIRIHHLSLPSSSPPSNSDHRIFVLKSHKIQTVITRYSINPSTPNTMKISIVSVLVAALASNASAFVVVPSNKPAPLVVARMIEPDEFEDFEGAFRSRLRKRNHWKFILPLLFFSLARLFPVKLMW